MARDGLIADQRLLEERQRQEEEQRQREVEQAAQELLNAQIVSPSVAGSLGLTCQRAIESISASAASRRMTDGAFLATASAASALAQNLATP